MGNMVLILERIDFIPPEWELYDKGIKSLSREMLKPVAKVRYDMADEVYIVLGKDKHYLKEIKWSTKKGII